MIMESGDHIKREVMDSDETESDSFGYECESGETVFYYCNNIERGKHRWPKKSSCSENTILRVQTSDVPDVPNELCSVATQTEDYSCFNHCTSMYVDNESQIENRESENNEIKQEVSDEDTVDVSEENTLNNTDVDDNLDEVSEEFEKDESLNTVITRKDLVQNVHPEHERNSDSHYCPHCSRKFQWKSHLDLHVRTHTGEKPHVCSYCDNAFARKADLIAHLRTHTGEKPFQCPCCDKAFTQKSHVKVHLRKHTGEKPYECLYCDKTFITRTEVNVHIRKHTGEKPYECLYCDKAFTQKSHFKDHLRIHTGEKPFECSYCDKAFTQKSHLKVHLRTHTGEKPYECSYCDKAFAIRGSLRAHLLTHVMEKPFECLNNLSQSIYPENSSQCPPLNAYQMNNKKPDE